MKNGLEDLPNFGSRAGKPCSAEAWALLEKRSQEWMTGEEIDRWHEICHYQVQHHPDPKMKEMFQRLGLLTKMRREVAEATCALAISPN